MFRHALVFALLAFAAAVPASAATIHLRAARAGVSGDVQLRLYRVGGEAADRWKTETTAAVPSAVSVELGGGTWQIELQSDRAWAAPAIVASDGEVTIDVWPAAVLRGTFARPSASTLRVAFDSQLALRGADGPSGQTNCVVDGHTWRCVVPAALEPLQLRLMPAGSAPVFLWDRLFEPGKDLDAGSIDIVPGASVVGFVSAAGKKKVDFSKARVTLVPAGGGEQQTVVSVSARGLFVFTGVTPGEYLVRASTRELVAAPVRVRVLPRLTAQLRDAIVLDAPLRVSVAITPPLAPSGEKWLVQLSATTAILNQGSAESDGTWSSEALPPGDYSISVVTKDGSQWDSADVTLRARTEQVSIAVPIVSARGTVMLGEKPLAAKLTFWQRGRNIVQSNEDGTFTATLPGVAGEEWQIEVESEKPAVTTMLRNVRGRVSDSGVVFDVTIPRTMISGRCIDGADQSPAGNAIVDIADVPNRIFRQVFTLADGTFDAIGLPPGSYRVTARGFLKQSDTIDVTLGDEPVTDLALTLRAEVEFKGRLFAPNQSPIPHARLFGAPRDVEGGTTLPQAESDATGGFDLVLPPATHSFDILVSAPGFALSLAHMQTGADAVVPVYCDPAGGRIIIASKSASSVWLHRGAARWHAAHLARMSGGALDEKNSRVATGLVEAGPWSACVAGKCVSGFLAPGAELRLSLDD